MMDLAEDLEELLLDAEQQAETPLVVRRCEWCKRPLPSNRYQLRICPRCRRESVTAFKNHEYDNATGNFSITPPEILSEDR